MTTPRALLLDLDGTLVDSAPEIAIAVNTVRHGFALPEVSLQTVRDWVGEGVGVLLQRALSEARPDAAALEEARTIFDLAYGDLLGTRAVPYPGVAEGLPRLRDAGFALACVTNKPEHFARVLLEVLGILEPIAVIVGGDTTPALKPEAGPARFAAEGLGVPIEDCLLVGDSEIDVTTARNAGCPVWCVRSGYARGQDADVLGADAVFDGFGDVAEALLSARPRS